MHPILCLAMTASFLLPSDDLTEPGISWDLAKERASRIRDVQYELTFQLSAGAEQVQAEVRATFHLADKLAPVILDWDGEWLGEVTVNGEDPGDRMQTVNNHLVLGRALLKEGTNEFRAKCRSVVAATGTPLTHYGDSATGEDYYYTLLVPSEAHRLFPCFDQPDLKARFTLGLTVPTTWKVVGNSPRVGVLSRNEPRAEPVSTHRFAPTPPLSTYLFAFAAGPFDVIHAEVEEGAPPITIYYRPSKEAEVDDAALTELHTRARKWLEEYFDVPYPFKKLDAVLLAGFPYGGMEHPGAIFYRETSLAFDHEPTEGELFRRETLIFHEVSHQWFGNLVTMEWFDDLWLKEGFATFMGYSVVADTDPSRQAWLRFHQNVKPPALSVDGTRGTVPVYQELGNMADAKSNYGPIVYNKAPAVLRALEARLGREPFRLGVKAFLEQNAWGNATWRDLIACLEESSGKDLTSWCDRFLLTAGMPKVRPSFALRADGNPGAYQLTQEPMHGEDLLWPLDVELLIVEADGTRRTETITLDGKAAPVESLDQRPAPRMVLLNPGDVAYGLFLPAGPGHELLEQWTREEDPLVRAVIGATVWQAVREAELNPTHYLKPLLVRLESENDALTLSSLLGRLGTCLHRYLSPEQAAPFVAQAESLLRGRFFDGDSHKLELFRALVSLSKSEDVLDLCRQAALGQKPAGLDAGLQDRYLAAAALLAASAADAEDVLARMAVELADQDIAKYVYQARAATPDAAVKQEYFQSYMNAGEPPEQWIQGSLGRFHWSGQTELTLPYLQQALDQMEWVKANRRIFFMPAWIGAFVNGHSSPEALAVVHAHLESHPDLPLDIRRKLLQSVDSLERTVRIRERFPGR